MKKTADEPLSPVGAGTETGITRREVVTGGAAALGAVTVLHAPGAEAQAGGSAAMRWDHEFDVVVVGAGCAGLTAAIRARDLGASVLGVEAGGPRRHGRDGGRRGQRRCCR